MTRFDARRGVGVCVNDVRERCTCTHDARGPLVSLDETLGEQVAAQPVQLLLPLRSTSTYEQSTVPVQYNTIHAVQCRRVKYHCETRDDDVMMMKTHKREREQRSAMQCNCALGVRCARGTCAGRPPRAPHCLYRRRRRPSPCPSPFQRASPGCPASSGSGPRSPAE